VLRASRASNIEAVSAIVSTLKTAVAIKVASRLPPSAHGPPALQMLPGAKFAAAMPV